MFLNVDMHCTSPDYSTEDYFQNKPVTNFTPPLSIYFIFPMTLPDSEHSSNCRIAAMVPPRPVVHAAVFALAALQALASDTFIAAVYEHAVILPRAAQEAVSPEDALALMNKNMDILEGAIKEAAQQVRDVSQVVLIVCSPPTDTPPPLRGDALVETS